MGRPKLSVDEHRIQGTYRRDRHGQPQVVDALPPDPDEERRLDAAYKRVRGASGRAFFRRLRAAYEGFTAAEVELLVQGAALTQLIADAEAEVRRDGITVQGAKGGKDPHGEVPPIGALVTTTVLDHPATRAPGFTVDLESDAEYAAALRKLEELREERAAEDAARLERSTELNEPGVLDATVVVRLNREIREHAMSVQYLDRAIARQEAAVRAARDSASRRVLERIRPEYDALTERVLSAARQLVAAVAAERAALERLRAGGVDVDALPDPAALFPWFHPPHGAMRLASAERVLAEMGSSGGGKPAA